MLRAFDYTEYSYVRKNIQNRELFDREKCIAQKYVYSNPVKIRPEVCPVCGNSRLEYLFHRWDINYYRCQECGSIFVNVQEDAAAGYLENKELKSLRISSEYQKEAEDRRSNMWDEWIHWIKYRAYRYIGKNTELYVVDYGDRYQGLVDRLQGSGLCGRYVLTDSILEPGTEEPEGADIVLYLNQLQHVVEPVSVLKRLSEQLKEDGLLLLSTRLGTGFDILTLKGGLDNIFPYEHIMLPSKEGLEILLDKAGFELLEFVTPGTLDIQYVLDNIERVEEGNLFAHALFKPENGPNLMDFQRFLQKAGLSSFGQTVARKKKRKSGGNIADMAE